MKKIGKMDFKKFLIWVVFVLAIADLIIFHEPICNWLAKATEVDHGVGLLTLIVTASAFTAAGLAFVWQHKSLEHQKEAGIKQEINGAWQVIANKAAGNSGKVEAIEFLAQQGKPLYGLDMSSQTNGGSVWLRGLNLKGLKARLSSCRFEGSFLHQANFRDANLCYSNFKGVRLLCVNFEYSNSTGTNFESASVEYSCLEGTMLWGSILKDAKFIESDLTKTTFTNAKDFDKAEFQNNHINSDSKNDLPETPAESKFQFDFVFNEDGTKKSEPELNKEGKRTGVVKYFIHLVDKKTKEPKK
jgi:uncharacterized protein YjbI with pentapeptide repeats